MKVLVACKRVPDPSAKIKVKQDGSSIEAEGLKFVISALDEVAIEEGLRMKERRGGEVILFSVGNVQAEEQLRMGLAMGADRGILVVYEGFPDSDLVARAIAAIFREEQPDLVLMGKVSPDTEAGQAGQLAAEYLGLPPAVITCDFRLNTPRYASVPMIMKARAKPIRKAPLDGLGVEAIAKVKLRNLLPPPQRKAGVRVESVKDLLRCLKEEAKVI